MNTFPYTHSPDSGTIPGHPGYFPLFLFFSPMLERVIQMLHLDLNRVPYRDTHEQDHEITKAYLCKIGGDRHFRERQEDQDTGYPIDD